MMYISEIAQKSELILKGYLRIYEFSKALKIFPDTETSRTQSFKEFQKRKKKKS